ncbi:hypothetical protein SDJN02_03302, partial [Cucurbita argyrosperma subsp. argyrosperma]
MPSRMCINPIHNKKGILHHSTNASSEERWETNSCAMDSLYDMDLISDTVPVILDNSKLWYQVQSTGMKLGSRVVAHVDQDRNNRSAILLPYKFLPSMAAENLRDASEKVFFETILVFLRIMTITESLSLVIERLLAGAKYDHQNVQRRRLQILAFTDDPKRSHE